MQVEYVIYCNRCGYSNDHSSNRKTKCPKCNANQSEGLVVIEVKKKDKK